jgi:hypothetical protein
MLDVQNANNERRRSLMLAIGAFVLVFIMWQSTEASPFLYPFRLVVTFVHEAGHGISAILSGGQFCAFEVMPNGAGLALTIGGSRLLILSMGYLGAALFGAVLFYYTNRARRVGLVAALVGLFFVGCALLFTGGGPRLFSGPQLACSGMGLLGNAQITVTLGAGAAIFLWLLGDKYRKQSRGFFLGSATAAGLTLLLVKDNVALLVGLVAGIALIALSVLATRPVLHFVLNALALITGFNAVNDIVNLWNMRDATRSDAWAIAQLTNLPIELWIILWVVLALIMMGISAYLAFNRPAEN